MLDELSTSKSTVGVTSLVSTLRSLQPISMPPLAVTSPPMEIMPAVPTVPARFSPPLLLVEPVLEAPPPSTPVPPLVALQPTKATHKAPPTTDDHARAFMLTKVAEPSDLASRQSG